MIAGLKPYSEMKDSGVEWLGRVPEHWEVRKLKYVVSFSGGGTPSKANESFWRGTIPWVSPKDMSGSSIDDTTDHITEEAVTSSSTSILATGALLMVVRSGILRRTIPVAINLVEVALNQDMKALRPRSGIVLSEFLRTFVQGSEATLIREWTKQGATVESIEHELMANSLMPLPPLPEQSAIVRYLDRADRRVRRLVGAKRKLIALLTEQKQAIIHRAVTRGLDSDVPMKDSGVEWLGEVPEHWDLRRNGRLFTQRNETGFAELPILEVSLRTGIRIRDFGNSDRKQVMFDRDKYKRALAGDIAYNMMRMWQGAVGVAPVDGLISPAYVVARPLLGTDVSYFEKLFRTSVYMQEVDNYSRGIVKDRNRLYWEDFKAMPTCCPPPGEQAAIVEYLDQAIADIDTATTHAHREIDLLNEYHTRLISDVVTGRLDVREAAAALPEVDPLADNDGPDDILDIDVDGGPDKLDTIPKKAEA